MSDKCELSNEELIKKVRAWVDKLCRTGGKGWSLQVPVNLDRDPDVLISELCQRFENLQQVESPGEEDGPWAEGFAERCGNAATCDHTRFVFQHSLLSDYFVCMSCGYVKKKKGGEWAPASSVESLLDTRSVDALPGGSTPSQYALPETAKELQDLIEFREMNFAMGNIFKACYRKKDSVDRLYDIRKIIWFAQREEQRLLKEEACKKQ